MSYTPKRGTKSEAMLNALQREKRMTTGELAAAGGARINMVHGLMTTAIKHGVVATGTVNGRRHWDWIGSLPAARPAVFPWPVPPIVPGFVPNHPTAPPDIYYSDEAGPTPTAPRDIPDEPQPDESFGVALWDDGELDIFGGGEIEQNGVPGVRLNRDQVARLRGLLNRVSLACHQHPSSGVGPGLPELVMPGWSRRAGSLPTRENGHQE